MSLDLSDWVKIAVLSFELLELLEYQFKVV